MFIHSCLCVFSLFCFFFFKQKTAYEMRISDWSSDVCSSDLIEGAFRLRLADRHVGDAAGRIDAVVEHDPAFDAAQARGTRIRRRDTRSEERRVGKECVSTCRSRWLP